MSAAPDGHGCEGGEQPAREAGLLEREREVAALDALVSGVDAARARGWR